MAKDDPRKTDFLSPIMATTTRAANKSLPPVHDVSNKTTSVIDALRSFNLKTSYSRNEGAGGT